MQLLICLHPEKKPVDMFKAELNTLLISEGIQGFWKVKDYEIQ